MKTQVSESVRAEAKRPSPSVTKDCIGPRLRREPCQRELKLPGTIVTKDLVLSLNSRVLSYGALKVYGCLCKHQSEYRSECLPKSQTILFLKSAAGLNSLSPWRRFIKLDINFIVTDCGVFSPALQWQAHKGGLFTWNIPPLNFEKDSTCFTRHSSISKAFWFLDL